MVTTGHSCQEQNFKARLSVLNNFNLLCGYRKLDIAALLLKSCISILRDFLFKWFRKYSDKILYSTLFIFLIFPVFIHFHCLEESDFEITLKSFGVPHKKKKVSLYPIHQIFFLGEPQFILKLGLLGLKIFKTGNYDH